MAKLYCAARRFWDDDRGQDLVEYALMGASVAVAAGAIFPPSVMPAVSTIFSKVGSCFNAI